MAFLWIRFYGLANWFKRILQGLLFFMLLLKYTMKLLSFIYAKLGGFQAKLRRFIVKPIIARKLRHVFRGLLDRRRVLETLLYSNALNVFTSHFKLDLPVILNNSSLKTFINYRFLYNKTVTASLLLGYILRQLSKLYLPGEIVGRIVNKLQPSKKRWGLSAKKKKWFKPRFLLGKEFKGLLIKCRGRFTRQQMASSMNFQAGRMPLSSIEHKVDYASGTVALKYGALGIKVYLARI